MIDRQASHPSNEPISDDLVNAFFDRELTEGASDEFFSKLRSNLPRCAEVARTQRAISLLREPIEAPDVSGRVLATLASRRRFLPERLRRMVTAGRLLAAGIALAAVAGIAVVDRVAPGFLRLTQSPQPVTDVVTRTAEEARHSAAQLASAMNGLRGSGADGSAAKKKVFLIEGLKPGVTSAKSLPPGSDDADSLVVYRGAGPDTRFILPEAVYIDRNAAILVPLGHMSSSRIGAMDWAGVSRENLFLLPAVEPGVVSGAVSDDARGEKPKDAKSKGP
jgi:hypothetical protein